MNRVRQNLGYGGDYKDGLSVSDLNAFIQKNTGSKSDIDAAKAVVAALPKNTDRITVGDLNAITGDGPSTSTVPSTGNPNASSNPAPLGIMHGGQYDGYLAYRPAGADPNNDSLIQYARPLGSEITGPNGEPAFDFGNGKEGYEAKDPQNPNNTIIQFMDAHDSSTSQQGSNADLKAKAQTDLNNSSNKDGDVSTIINNHYSNFGAAVTSNQDGVIGAQDWNNFANANDDPKMDALVQDPLERAKMRAVAQTVVDRINNAKNMSLNDAIGVFKNNGTNKSLINGAPGGNTYEKMEAIATGRATLAGVSDPAEREKIRQAAARIIYVPMTPDERSHSGGGGSNNHLDDNKYGKAQGGATLFTFMDNGFSSNDNDGSFDVNRFDKVAN